MNTFWKTPAITLSLGMGAMVLAPPALADYPERPVTMIVAFGAGGSTDTMARIFANYMGEELGQRFVVENRAGAGGEIGWVTLANAAPDGYTIGLINLPAIEVYPITRPDTIGYSLDQFRPLLNVVTDPGVLAVAADSPYETLDDLVAAARENPGGVTVSHEGVGGDDHLAALNFARAADVELNFVSFSGNAEATAALLGGHIDAFEGNMSEVAAQVEDGAIRALAVWSRERLPQIPDVPTGAEQGYDVVSAASRGIAVPAGVPDDVYQTLLDAAESVVNDDAFLAELENLNMPVVPIIGEEYEAYVEDSHQTLRQLWETDPWLE